MGRLIQEKIKQPLAEELLFGKLVHGGEVKVRIKDNACVFEITSAPPKPVKGKKKAGPRLEKDEEPASPEAPEAQPEG
jgi:ATP-dependent Clp protease ATP-binding subunit ClpA